MHAPCAMMRQQVHDREGPASPFHTRKVRPWASVKTVTVKKLLRPPVNSLFRWLTVISSYYSYVHVHCFFLCDLCRGRFRFRGYIPKCSTDIFGKLKPLARGLQQCSCCIDDDDAAAAAAAATAATAAAAAASISDANVFKVTN